MVLANHSGGEVGQFHHSRATHWGDKQSLRSFDHREITEMPYALLSRFVKYIWIC